MQHQMFVAASFAAFLLLFIGVGLYSGLSQPNTTNDYLLASRGANPWLTGLSTVATGNSGFMFIGLIGFTYTIGIAAAWVLLGWIVGDYIAWFVVHRRLRRVSEQIDSSTVVAFLSQDNDSNRWLTFTSGLITISFLGIYAATQLQAGSKALSVIFGWDYVVGIVLGAVIVTIYCFAGGIRASIWVGSIQSALMILSMVILLGVAVVHSGGLSGLWQQLKAADPALLSLAPSGLRFGVVPFILSWLVAGFGVVGQPHIMSRIMAIDSSKNVATARNVYAALYCVFAIAALGVGLTARVLLPDLMLAGGDVELALPKLAENLLPALLVGIVLSGLFAATISTADAQILTCSATLTQDLLPGTGQSYWMAKAGTLVMALLILVIALVGDDNVFVLATIAWSTLAAGLGPLMVVRAFRKSVRTPVAMAMMLTGVATALTWRLGLHLAGSACEALPGMVAGAALFLVAQLWPPPGPAAPTGDAEPAQGASSAPESPVTVESDA
ncbi:sodium:proline symporter [filamentous cyanobacterium CCP5]|nr:sodium:proline symporter [filamentous cyanobacterium CCP5]